MWGTRPARINDDPRTHDRATCPCRYCLRFREAVRDELYRVRLSLMYDPEEDRRLVQVRYLPR